MTMKLFKDAGINEITIEQNEKLIKVMKKIPGGKNSNISAGFTYLGQMISHDIVKSTSGEDDRSFPVKPNLMLDSIYGDKNFRDQNHNILNHKFLFSNPIGDSDKKFKNRDIYRINGEVKIPDIRNDENFLISQMHLFWQKVHNLFVETGIGKLCKQKAYCDYDCFNLAREIVIKLFQQVVIEDYLFNILDVEIYQKYINKIKEGNGNLFFISKKQYMSTVPLEFSHAAFRFGHSMVRNDYTVNSRVKEAIGLHDLFNPNHEPIPTDFLVDWRRFFDIDSDPSANIKAFKINHNITKEMLCLPNGNSIIKLNLEAGFNSKLPSGIQILNYIREHYKSVAVELKLNTSDYDEINLNCYPEYNQILEGKIEKMPLWLYILNEAEFQNQESNRLGKLGSIIVAETIFKSIQQSKISILNNTDSLFIPLYKLERLNYFLLRDTSNPSKLYQGFLNDFRRFKMSDLINFTLKHTK